MKQLGLTSVMYTGDNEDRFPFSGRPWPQFDPGFLRSPETGVSGLLGNTRQGVPAGTQPRTHECTLESEDVALLRVSRSSSRGRNRCGSGR